MLENLEFKVSSLNFNISRKLNVFSINCFESIEVNSVMFRIEFLCQIVYEIDLVIFVIFLEIFVQRFKIFYFNYFLYVFSRILEVVVKENEYF